MQHSQFLALFHGTWVKRFAGIGLALIFSGLLVPATIGADDNDTTVRWDIIRVVFNEGGTGSTGLYPGGEAWAATRGGPGEGNDGHPAPPVTNQRIKFTGSGTFKPPKNGKVGWKVTGGGTWERFMGNVPTGELGAYQVTAVLSWEFANFQNPGNIDHIGELSEAANGTAVLKIRFSNGQEGTLVLGCHGPGAPPRIFEGVAVTKAYETYWYPEEPTPADPNKNRTLFHVSRDDDDDDEDSDH